jgi:NADH-quinone oxidoreductase subunit N
VFLLAGLAFKVSAVPFHMWTPDVYEGAPTPVTAFFAAAPKIAGMAVFMRVVIQPFPAITADWQQIVVFIAIASMALGAFAAIGQTNIKRLLAYSSIGHVGYALVGLAAGTPEGVRGVIVYMIIYLAMTLGTFGCILAMRRRDGAVEEIADLAGPCAHQPPDGLRARHADVLARRHPAAGRLLRQVLRLPGAIQAGLVALAVIGVVLSVVGAFYYLRIVKLMFFDEAVEPFEPMPTRGQACRRHHRRVRGRLRDRGRTDRGARPCGGAVAVLIMADLEAARWSPSRRSIPPMPRRCAGQPR